MKVVNSTGYPGSQWRVQVASALFATTPGENYAISYWVKAASGSGSIRMSTQTSGGGLPNTRAIRPLVLHGKKGGMTLHPSLFLKQVRQINPCRCNPKNLCIFVAHNITHVIIRY